MEASEDLVGVQLMTLYQAKGLEFDHVFVPQLLKDEWPAREFGAGLFPRELLKEAVPAGDIHTEEERRLLYVALTRARDRLVRHDDRRPGRARRTPRPSSTDLQDGRRPGASGRRWTGRGRSGALADGAHPRQAMPPGNRPRPCGTPAARHARCRPSGSAAWPCASAPPSCWSCWRASTPPTPRPVRPAARLSGRLRGPGRSCRRRRPTRPARTSSIPLTLRVVALDSAAGANLLDVAPLPRTFSYSQVDTYERCPLQYALQKVYAHPVGSHGPGR